MSRYIRSVVVFDRKKDLLDVVEKFSTYYKATKFDCILDFQKIAPFPEECDVDAFTWEEWGTCWNATDGGVCLTWDDRLGITFETGYNSPQPIFEKLSALLGHGFTVYWVDEYLFDPPYRERYNKGKRTRQKALWEMDPADVWNVRPMSTTETYDGWMQFVKEER